MSNSISKIVIKHGDEFATTSEIVAQNTDTQHKNVLELINGYKSDIEQFGALAFETRKSGGRPTEYAVLNEQQATFLLTLMRNSEIVVRFKVELVKEFYRMRSSAVVKRDAIPAAKVNDHMIAFKTGFQVLSKIKGVDQNLLATQGLKLVQDGTGIPIHDYFRVALPSPEPKNVPELNATAIGKRYNIGPRKMNEQLEILGLIERGEKSKPVLTEEGAKYGAMVPYTERGHSGYQPLFFRSVFDLLDGLIGEPA